MEKAVALVSSSASQHGELKIENAVKSTTIEWMLSQKIEEKQERMERQEKEDRRLEKEEAPRKAQQDADASARNAYLDAIKHIVSNK